MTPEQSRPLTPQEEADLAVARELVAGGIPVFAARPAMKDGEWDPTGGTDGCGYWLPPAWQKTVPTEKWLDPTAPGYENKAWRPGWALGAVMGQGLDLLDVDPRNGGEATREALVQAGMWPRAYGAADTPSGGTHEFIASLNVRSLDGVRPGLDVKAGDEHGQGRGFAFIAPTHKLSKSTGEIAKYRWTTVPDLDALTDGDDDSGEAIAEIVRTAKNSGSSANTAATGGDDPFAEPRERKHAGPIPDGQRHAKLMSYAGWLRALGLPFTEAQTLMERRWKNCAQPQPGSSGRSSPTPLPWPDAREPLPLSEAIDKLRDGYGRWAAGQDVPEDEGAPTEGAEAGAEAPGRSWGAQPLDDVLQGLLDGSLHRLVPTVGHREDGGALFYTGKVNGIAGASGSGKSWTALTSCVQELDRGQHVVYVDLEDDAIGMVGRLLDMGADPDAVRQRFHYVRPDEAYKVFGRERLLALVADVQPSIVVIDSTGEAMALDGAKPNDDDDTARWFRSLPAPIARLGPAVVVLDHVVKAEDGGLWPIGSQRKRAAISGAQYMQAPLTPFAKGKAGAAKLTCAKDRHGTYAMSEQVAVLHLDPEDGGVRVSLTAPRVAASTDEKTFRPTHLMERVSRLLEDAPEPYSRSAVSSRVTGKKAGINIALDVLLVEGYLTVVAGARGAQLHTSTRPYREADDPLSDKHKPTGERVEPADPFGNASDRSRTRSPLKEGERGPGLNRTSDPVAGPGQDRVGNGSAQSSEQDQEYIPAPQQGPCIDCHKPTRKYGPEASKRCPACQELASQAAGV